MNRMYKVKHNDYCPQCREQLESTSPYTPWCYHCNWNVSPETQKSQPNQSVSQYRTEKVCKLLDESLLNSMISGQSKKPRFQIWFVQLCEVILALAVYIGSASLLGLAVLLSVNYSFLLAFFVSGLMIAATLWSVFPRFETSPPSDVIADAEQFPQLNQIVTDVANALGVDKPDVLLTEHFDATFGRIGWRRKPLLFLGHPFLAILTPNELIGLIAHELAHDKDGSVNRKLFVQFAYSALVRWCRMLNPWQFTAYSKLFLPLSLLTLLVWLPLRLFKSLFSLVRRRDAHYGEFIADQLSIEVAGNASTESLMRKSLYGHILPLHLAYMRATPANKYHAIHQQLAQVPERELERLWRIAHIMSTNDFSQTHPPIQNRLAFVNACAGYSPQVEISAEAFEQFKHELIVWPCIIAEREAEALAALQLDSEQTATGVSVAAAD